VNWSVQAAITTDALSENISFVITPLLDYVHSGTISTGGLGGASDRDLGDFFTNDVDEKGRLIVTFGMDGDDGLNQRGSAVMFAKQLEGPFLLDNVGPIARFDNTTEGLTVFVDASDSYGRESRIVEYIWDWGDGTNATGEVAFHTYNESGEYEISLKVINEDDMRARTTSVVSVSRKETPADYTLLFVILSILMICIAVFVYFTRKGKSKVVEVEAVPVSTIPSDIVEVNPDIAASQGEDIPG
jgi:PKD repeat protein